jgi:hypothetical protein
MKITLIRPNEWPSGGWQFIQPEIPWVNPNPLASLDSIAKQLVLVRGRNPRHNLSLDLDSARDDILTYNYQRLGDEQRVKFFLTGEQAEAVKKNTLNSLSRRVVEAVGTVKQMFAGSKTLIEAFGGAGRPVAQALADQRAAVCLECPLNLDKGESFKTKVVEKIKDLIEAKNQLKLQAKGEAGLHICDACGCVNSLKVWTPLQHIIANLPAADFDKLHPQCWVRAEKKTLTLVMPFCESDFIDLQLLLNWMNELGGLKSRACVFVADCKMSQKDLDLALEKGRGLFGQVELVKTPHALPDESWPLGANWLWLTAAKHMEKLGHPWFWCEPDCIPLRAGWLDDLDRAYQECQKPFLGCLVKKHHASPASPASPAVHMNGIAVYPADAFQRLGPRVAMKVSGACAAFDLVTHDLVVPFAQHSPLIQHFWGQINVPPVFVERRTKGDPFGALPLSFIRKDAAVFHRSKGGGLIRKLRGSLPLTIVITSFERPDHLRRAFDSCIAAGVEHIVIASSGDLRKTQAALDGIGDSALKVATTGTSNQSWLQGIEAVQTEYAALLHDDDLLLLDYPSLVAPALRAKADFVMVQAGSHGVPNYITKDSDKDGVESSSVLREKLDRHGSLAISPIRGVFKKADLAQWLRECEEMPKACYLRPGFLAGNDLAIWLKATDKYPEFYNVPKPGVSFGHWPGSTTVAELAKNGQRLRDIYDTARAWAKGQSNPQPVPLRIVTIVLDGMPFIAQHLQTFNRLKVPWEWHIVEGAAANTHCTKWCKPQAARFSKDGTSEYLDSIAAHPRVHLYRKPLWDGKVEMVNAPLADINSACVLLEVDCDEFWTAEQIEALVKLFASDESRTHAMFWCRYFFGPHLVMTSRNCYANNPAQDWKRAWRFRPGDKFLTHEPPHLSGEAEPFMHEATEKAGLVFDHYGYAQRSQVEFKEAFYGYKGAVNHWQKLQGVKAEAKLSDYLPWVRPEQSGVVEVIT